MKRFKRCILHVGIAKTATTTLQSSFSENRDKLAERGILYPQIFGRQNHVRLAVYAMNESRWTPLKRWVLDPWNQDVDRFRRDMETELATELLAAEQDTLLLSNEHLHLNLNSFDEKCRLKTLLDPFCEDYRILVYLRRQDRVAVSLISTRLRGGANNIETLLPRPDGNVSIYDYRELIQQYQAVFGNDRVEPVIFEPEELIEGDVVRDAYHRIGISDVESLRSVGKTNESLSAPAQGFLAVFNRWVPRNPNGRSAPIRRKVIDALNKSFPGSGTVPSRVMARSFYDRFSDGNEWIRARYFPEKETLFKEDFSHYPEATRCPTESLSVLRVAPKLGFTLLSDQLTKRMKRNWFSSRDGRLDHNWSR